MVVPFILLQRTLTVTSAVTRRWRPRSLLQLVLLAFMVVMLPLAVLMIQAGQGLSELSRLADVSARQAVEETRRARSLGALALEMERGARQYAVVEQEGLLEIFDERLAEFRQLLAQQRRLLPDDPHVAALEQALDDLAELPDLPLEAFRSRLSDFLPFAQHTEAMRQATNRRIDERIDTISARAQDVRVRLWWQTAALVSASLVLMLLSTRLIIQPIRVLERRILGIGSIGGDSDQSPPLTGPAELVNLGERLDWLATRLDELEAQKQQFLRHMSHELKTPLSTIREGASLLSDGVAGEVSPHQREILEMIDTSGRELQHLIEELLEYNLSLHDQLDIKQLDVATVVREVLAKHRLALANKEMRVSCFDGPLTWRLDRTATARVLDNLVSNALAYGEDGGVLEIRAQPQPNRQLMIEVANSGEPIAEEDRERLFDAFYQGKVRRKGPLKGSGIGLSVAADCAQRQEGRLELVDDPRLAVCFRLTLPWPVSPSPEKDDENATSALVGEISMKDAS